MLKKSACSIKCSLYKPENGEVGAKVFWNARAAFSGISWPLSPLETKMVLN